jgi:hypothetical protein
MKRKKAPSERTTAGTLAGAKMRADGNKLTDVERDKLGGDFLKLYYGGALKPAPTHRR